MKYLSIFTPDTQSEPAPEVYGAMGKLITEYMEKGILIDTGGLLPVSQGVTLRRKDGKVSKVDGPFAESKELVGGYAILQADTLEEIVAACDRFFEVGGGDGVCEIRAIMQG